MNATEQKWAELCETIFGPLTKPHPLVEALAALEQRVAAVEKRPTGDSRLDVIGPTSNIHWADDLRKFNEANRANPAPADGWEDGRKEIRPHAPAESLVEKRLAKLEFDISVLCSVTGASLAPQTTAPAEERGDELRAAGAIQWPEARRCTCCEVLIGASLYATGRDVDGIHHRIDGPCGPIDTRPDESLALTQLAIEARDATQRAERAEAELASERATATAAINESIALRLESDKMKAELERARAIVEVREHEIASLLKERDAALREIGDQARRYETQLSTIRQAMGGYPDSDLVSLATTLKAQSDALEKAQADAATARGECERLREANGQAHDWLRRAQVGIEQSGIKPEYVGVRGDIANALSALSSSPPPATGVECQDAWHNGASTFTGQSDCPTCKSPVRDLRNHIATPPQPSPDERRPGVTKCQHGRYIDECQRCAPRPAMSIEPSPEKGKGEPCTDPSCPDCKSEVKP